jgi:ABC-type Fe3+ transport system permease subunit
MAMAALLAAWAAALYGVSRYSPRRGWRRSAAVGGTARTRAGRRGDRGASALEWAIISAILVTAAVIIGGVIYNVVKNKSDQIEQCGSLGAEAQNCGEP